MGPCAANRVKLQSCGSRHYSVATAEDSSGLQSAPSRGTSAPGRHGSLCPAPLHCLLLQCLHRRLSCIPARRQDLPGRRVHRIRPCWRHRLGPHLEGPRQSPLHATCSFSADRAGSAQGGLLLAILFYRFSSERILEKEIPPQVQIVTRRYQRERLMQAGLSDDVPAEMKDLRLLPDGHWQNGRNRRSTFAGSISPGASLGAALRCFPASARSRAALPSGKSQRGDRSLRLLAARKCLRPGQLRLARDNSYYHLWRLWTEAAARGLLANIQPEQREEALRRPAPDRCPRTRPPTGSSTPPR